MIVALAFLFVYSVGITFAFAHLDRAREKKLNVAIDYLTGKSNVQDDAIRQLTREVQVYKHDTDAKIRPLLLKFDVVATPIARPQEVILNRATKEEAEAFIREHELKGGRMYGTYYETIESPPWVDPMKEIEKYHREQEAKAQKAKK